MDGHSITILPESDDLTLCVRMQDLLCLEDHEAKLAGEIRKRIEKNGFLNLVIWYEDNHMFMDPATAEANMRGFIDMAPYARRTAYINPTERKLLQIKLFTPLYGGEVRIFPSEEKDQAILWAKQGRPA